MAVSTKILQIKIKSDGDVFHQLWKANPHQLPGLTPTNIQNCQIHEGEGGTEGCVLSWNYFHDGKHHSGKTLITKIDEEKKSITFKVIEADIMELYKTYVFHIHVDTDGLDNLVTWTIEYEKLNPNVPEPDGLLAMYEKITKDIETHHLQN